MKNISPIARSLIDRVTSKILAKNDRSLPDHSRSGDSEVSSRPLEMEVLEPRILFSGSVDPGTTTEPAQDTGSGTAQEAPAGDSTADNGAPANEGNSVATPPQATEGGDAPVEGGETAVVLTDSEVAAVAEVAAQKWIDYGLNSEQMEALSNVSYQVADLAGGHIGSASGDVITVDIDAAGIGWFVDSTPYSNEEFSSNGVTLLANPGGEADGRIDLLTTILHEQGHILGIDEFSTPLMEEILNTGERKVVGYAGLDGFVDSTDDGDLEFLHAGAMTRIWSGAGDGTSWNDAANWGGDAPDTAGEEAYFAGAAPAVINLGGTVTVGAVHFAGSGYEITGGTLDTDDVFNESGTNTISAQLSSAAFAGSVSGGTLSVTNLGNTASVTAGSWDLSGGTLQVDAGGTESGLGGAGVSVDLVGGTLDVDGVSGNLNNALDHFGYHINNDNLAMDLDGNGGMMGGGDPTTGPNFNGQALLTDGPGGRGLDFNNDGDFTATGAIGQNNNYSNLWVGFLTADVSGTWGLRNAGDDDRAGHWIDLNQNGIFESSTPGLGQNRGEQLSWENGGNKTVNLIAGETYMVAFTHREGGGGSRADFRFTRPGGTEEIIKPSDENQAGLWNALVTQGPANADLSNTVNVGVGGGSVELESTVTFASGVAAADATLNVNAANSGALKFTTTVLANDLTVDTTAGTRVFLSDVSGTGNLISEGDGSVILPSANTFSGDVNVQGNSTVVARDAGSLGTSGGTTNVAIDGTLEIDGTTGIAGETLNLVGKLSSTGGRSTWDGPISLSGDGQIGGSADLVVDGVIGGAGNLAKVDANSVILTAANTYAGTTTVGGGRLVLEGPGSTLGTGDATVNAGGQLLLKDGATLTNDVTLFGSGPNGEGALAGSSFDIAHYGYHINNDGLAMDLNNNAGMMGGGNPTQGPNFNAVVNLGAGPGGRGLDFNNDADFVNSGAIGQNDNYSNLWLGTIVVDASTAGNWTFRNAGDDDRAGIWVDLDQDGTFESSTPGLGSNRGEQLSWEDGGAKTVNLAAGEYLVAFTHREGGGGSRADFRVSNPTLAEEIVNPTTQSFWKKGATNTATGTVSFGDSAVEIAALGGVLDIQSDLDISGTALTLDGAGDILLSGDVSGTTAVTTVNGIDHYGYHINNDNLALNLDGNGGMLNGGAQSNPDLIPDPASTQDADYPFGGNSNTGLELLLATTANINLTGAITTNIDGTDVFTGDTIIVKNQTDPTENGLYRALGPHNGNVTSYIRHSFFDVNGEGPNLQGTATGGTVNNGDTFHIDPNATIDIGTDAINWTAGAVPPTIQPNDPTGFQNFFGQALLTDGPGNRGLDFNNDGDFNATGAIGQNNNFSNLFLSTLTVSAADAGNWNFRINMHDDPAGIWVDLNQNGVFESNTGTLADNNGELIAWNGGCCAQRDLKTVNLAAGEYMVAFVQREGGGGSQIDITFANPNVSERTIKPTDPAQAGYWTTTSSVDDELIKNGSGTTTLSGNNTYDGLTTVNDGTLVAASDTALGTDPGITVVGDNATLALQDDVTVDETVTLNGTLSNVSGDNTFTGDLSKDSVVDSYQISSLDGELTLDTPIDLGFGDIEFSGAGDVVVDGVISGINAPTSLNGLNHFGFHINNDNLAMNLDQNGGMAGNGDPTSFNNFFGQTLLLDGPGGRGLDFNNDTDFINSGAIGQTNNYSNLWIGFLTADTTGNWGLRNAGDDDRSGIWFDTDQDGVFESSTAGLGSDRGEQLAWEDTGNKTVALTAGQTYMVAFTHREGGGGSRADFRFTRPGGGEAIIKPTDAGQAGLWSAGTFGPTDNELTKTGTGTVTLNGANTYGGETRVEEGTLVAANDGALGTALTGTTVADGATLAFQGDISIADDVSATGSGAAGQLGVIANLSGTNTLSGNVTAPVLPDSVLEIGSESGTLTVSGDVDLGLSKLTLDGAGDLEISGDISGNGVATVIDAYDARHFDFNNDGFLSQIGAGAADSGLLGQTPDAELYSDARLQFDNDGQYNAFFGTAQNDNFSTLFVGEIVIPDRLGGNTPYAIEFGTNRADDEVHFYLDLNQNGVFEAPNNDNENDLSGTDTNERILQRGCCGNDFRTLTVAPGTYRYAVAQREGGGGSQVEPTIDLNDGNGRQTFDPGDMLGGVELQLRFDSNNQVMKMGSGTATLSGNNTYNEITTVMEGTLVAGSAGALGDAGVGTTVVDGATLGLTGGVTVDGEALTLNGDGFSGDGALVSLAGSNTVGASSSIAAEVTPLGTVGIGATTGATLTIDADIDLQLSKLNAYAEGDIIVNGVIGSSVPGSIIDPTEEDVILGNALAGLAGLNPLGYFQFNEGSGNTATDSSGAGNDGVITDAVYAVGHTGEVGDTALSFDGSGDRVVVANPGYDLTANNQTTVSLWAFGDPANPRNQTAFSGNPNSNGGGNRIVLSHLPWGNNSVFWDAGRVGTCCDGGKRIQTANVGTTSEDGWHQWTLVKDNTGGRGSEVWLDGALFASESGDVSNFDAVIQSLTIGAENQGGGNSYFGLIDDFAIYDYALSQAEIEQVYAARNGEGVLPSDNSLMKMGTGTLTVTATNTYTGETTIMEGTLDVDGEIAGSGVVVSDQGAFGNTILTGSGTVDAPVVGETNSIIQTEGNGGTLTVGDGSTNAFTTDGKIIVSAGDTLTIDDADIVGLGVYNLIDGTLDFTAPTPQAFLAENRNLSGTGVVNAEIVTSVYQTGFTWNRATDWGTGSEQDTQTDANGNNAWSYHLVSSTDNNGPGTWYQNAQTGLTFDGTGEWEGGVDPDELLIDQTTLRHDAGSHIALTPTPGPFDSDFDPTNGLDGWTVLNGGAMFRNNDQGGMAAANSSTNLGFGHDAVHENFLVESPQFQFDGSTLDGTNAFSVSFVGGQGNQGGSVAPFDTPADVMAFNGGNSAPNGLKAIAFLNVDTGEYDAEVFDPGNGGGIQTVNMTSAQLDAAGVDLNATYRLHYYDNDSGSWGWTQLNEVHVAAEEFVPSQAPNADETPLLVWTNPTDTTINVDINGALDIMWAGGGAPVANATLSENGTIIGGLLGNDLTDLDGAHNEGAYNLDSGGTDNGGFDAQFFGNNETGFGGGEFAFNSFDDAVGGGGAKWCCDFGAAGQHVGAQFSSPKVLTHFTITSSNDTPSRDATVWRIEGSNDAVVDANGDLVSGTWSTIFDHSTDSNIFTARNQTHLYNSAESGGVGGAAEFATGTGYTSFRYVVDDTGQGPGAGGARHALNELEFFGFDYADPNTRDVDYALSVYDASAGTWSTLPTGTGMVSHPGGTNPVTTTAAATIAESGITLDAGDQIAISLRGQWPAGGAPTVVTSTEMFNDENPQVDGAKTFTQAGGPEFVITGGDLVVDNDGGFAINGSLWQLSTEFNTPPSVPGSIGVITAPGSTFSVGSFLAGVSHNNGNDMTGTGDVKFIGTLAAGGTAEETITITSGDNNNPQTIAGLFGGQLLTSLDIQIVAATGGDPQIDFVAFDDITFTTSTPAPTPPVGAEGHYQTLADNLTITLNELVSTVPTTISPGPDNGTDMTGVGTVGTLGTGTLSLHGGTTVKLDIDGATNDQLTVSGTVNLNDAILELGIITVPTVGADVLLVDNDGTDAVNGTFAGISEGGIVTDSNTGLVFSVTYKGGTGNDIVLTSEGTAETGASINGDNDLVIEDIGDGDADPGTESSTDDRLTVTVVTDSNGNPAIQIVDPNQILGAFDIPGAEQPNVHTIIVPFTAFDNLIIRTNDGHDIINVADLTGFGQSVTVDGGGTDGEIDEILFDTVAVGDAGENYSLTAETVLFNFDSSLSVTGGGTIDVTATGGGAEDFIGLQLKRASLSSEGGAITLEGEGGSVGNHNDGVQINVDSTITTTGGSVSITGTATSTVGQNDGVSLVGGSDVTVGGAGTITIEGTSSGVNDSYGVLLFSGTTLTSNTGEISVTGSSASSGPRNSGVYTNGATVITTGGSITLDGAGNGAGSGNDNNGLRLTATSIGAGGAGGVTLTGTGGSGTNSNVGVEVGVRTEVTTASGNIVITGTGGAGTGVRNRGAEFQSLSSVISGGDLNITGTAGTGTSYNEGFYAIGATLEAAGTVTIIGAADGSGSRNSGVSATRTTITGGGDVNITGTGSTDASGRFNSGIILNRATVSASANLFLLGNGGTGNGYNRGIYGVSSDLSGGTFDIMGTADATTTGRGNAGVSFLNTMLSDTGTITGAAGGSAGASGNFGVFLQNLASGLSVNDVTGTSANNLDDALGGNYFNILPALLLAAGAENRRSRQVMAGLVSRLPRRSEFLAGSGEIEIYHEEDGAVGMETRVVGADALAEQGIEVPEVPEGARRILLLTGDESAPLAGVWATVDAGGEILSMNPLKADGGERSIGDLLRSPALADDSAWGSHDRGGYSAASGNFSKLFGL